MIFAAVAGPSTAGEAVNFLAPMEIAAKTATPPSSNAFLVMLTSLVPSFRSACGFGTGAAARAAPPCGAGLQAPKTLGASAQVVLPAFPPQATEFDAIKVQKAVDKQP